MLIKPINSIIKTKKDPATMSYLGMVEDNMDPKKLGRLRVRIAPFSDYATDELPWACPILGAHGNSSSSGGINIPEIGSQVRVSFPSEDLTAPYYSGAELNEINRTTMFDEHYPNAYGYKDSTGNFIKVDKEDGTIHIQHQSTSNIHMTADGSLIATMKNGATLTLTSNNAFSLTIAGVEILGMPDGSLTINNESSLDIKALDVNIDATKVTTTGELNAGNGYSGKLWLVQGMATVTNGIITSVEGV